MTSQFIRPTTIEINTETIPHQYKLLSADNQKELETNANLLAQDGWELYGNITAVIKSGYWYFSQWMVKPGHSVVRQIDSTTELNRVKT